jgi:8-amino-7-oxononanoate synthase
VKSILAQLEQAERSGLARKLRTPSNHWVNYSTNDYLSLSGNQAVIEAAALALKEWGAGAGGSRLMTGNNPLHSTLEQKLAQLTGTGDCLLFGSGFLANTGVLKAIAERGDAIFADRLNHASLVDGALASGAMVRRYSHCDAEHLEKLLKQHRGAGRGIIVTESLFSMDGDIAPLEELERLAADHDCILMVDEAHAIGVFGNHGGLCMERGIKAGIVTGTLSKALGGYGGFACSSVEVKRYLVNRSRTLIYSTGLPPASAGAALGALEYLRQNPDSGKHLQKRATLCREMMQGRVPGLMQSASQIIPVLTGCPARTMAISADLEKKGVIAAGIRPPTVPSGTSRLRFSITLAHTPEQIERTVEILGELL